MVRRIIRKLTISEISSIDRPAQEHARAVIMKRAPATEGDPPQDYVKPTSHIGPEHARLHSLATDAARATPGLHYSRAVANIFESNAALRERVKAEHFAHAMANADRQQGNGTMGKIDFAKAVQSDDAVEFKKHLNAGDFDEMSKSDWHRLMEDGAKPRHRRNARTGVHEVHRS